MHWPVYNQYPRNLPSIVACILCSLYQPDRSTSQRHDGNENHFHKNIFQNSFVRRILLNTVDRSGVRPNHCYRRMHQSHDHRGHSLHNGNYVYILLQKCHCHILKQTKCNSRTTFIQAKALMQTRKCHIKGQSKSYCETAVPKQSMAKWQWKR